MALPTPAPRRKTIVLSDGSDCEVRSLTRGEVNACRDAEEPDAVALAFVFQTNQKAVLEWRDGVPFEDYRAITDAVMELSGLGDGSGNSGPSNEG